MGKKYQLQRLPNLGRFLVRSYFLNWRRVVLSGGKRMSGSFYPVVKVPVVNMSIILNIVNTLLGQKTFLSMMLSQRHQNSAPVSMLLLRYLTYRRNLIVTLNKI